MTHTVEERLSALEERLVSLGAENEALRARLAGYELEAARSSGRIPEPTAPADTAPGRVTTEPRSPLDRRALLGRAGAAALGGAALAATAGVGTAGAANGEPLALGQANGATAGTSLAASGVGPVLGLTADGLTDHVLRVTAGQALGNPVFVSGTSPNDMVRVEQSGSGAALSGQTTIGSSGTAVIGAAMGGTGVHGVTSSSSHAAVRAQHVGDGPALDATSGGIALIATGGRAAVRLTPKGTAGAPTGLLRSVGDVVVDSTGALFVCVNGDPDPKWRRVAASWPGFDPGSPSGTGGAINLLATPFRLFDSRPGTTAPLGGAGALPPSTNTVVQVTGTEPVGGGDPVPTGALGLLCTITVTATEGAGGFLKAFPASGTVPGTSVLNWFGAGQNLATTTIVRLSTTGALTLRSGSNPTQVLVDVIGFLA